MNQGFIPSKLTRPGGAQICRRPRLFNRLDQSTTAGLTWIQGPPGAGKTALLASWTSTHRKRPLWFQLDGGDGDVASFFYYLEIAARHFIPDAALPSFSNDWLDAPMGFARAFFRKLFSYSGAPKLLVFDDYHAILPTSTVHAALIEGLAERPKGVQVVFASRNTLPAEFSRYRIHGDIHFVSPSDLTLSIEECNAITKLRKQPIAADRVAYLRDRSEGWAAGFVLLLATDTASNTPELEDDRLFDYYAHEVFTHFDTDTQSVLLKTSLLPEIPESIAASFAGIARAGKILRELVRKGYFVYQHQGNETSFRYHHLFQDFLTNRARALLGDQVTALQSRAASLLRTNGNTEKAVELACAASEWRIAAEIFLDTAPGLYRQGRLALMRQQTDRFPEDRIASNPWLGYWRALALFPIDSDVGIALMKSAYRVFETKDDIVGRAFALAAIVDFIALYFDDLSPLAKWIESLDEIEKRIDALPSDAQGALSAAAVNALANFQPRHASIPDWTHRAFNYALYGDEETYRFNAGRAILWYFGFWGNDLHRTKVIIDALTPLFQDADPMNRILWFVAKSNYHLYLADAEKCLEAADSGLAIAEASGCHRWVPLLMGFRVWGQILRNDFQAAQHALQSLADVTTNAPRALRFLYHYIAGIFALRTKDHRLAREHGTVAYQLAESIGMPFVKAAAYSILAIASRSKDDRFRLSDAVRQCRDAGYRVGEAACFFALAVASHRCGEEDSAKRNLVKGLLLAKELGVFNLIWISPEDMADLCAMAVEENIAPAFVIDFIQKLRIPANDGAHRLASWPWPASIHVLEGYVIRRAYQTDPQSHKAQQKPLELLRALVDAGPRGRSVPYLTDLLWPDSDDEKKSRNAFYITVHRLRQLLGNSDTVVLAQGRFAVNPQVVYVDVWELGTLLGRAESLKRLSSTEGEALALRIEKMWNPKEMVSFENNEETWVERLAPRIDRLRLRLKREGGRSS